MMEQLRFGTANIGGSYDSSRRAEQAVASARSAMAHFLNCAKEEILGGTGPERTGQTEKRHLGHPWTLR